MNKGSLPGLYYDPEKKRYFPIQANHQAFGSASKYSQENVRKRKRERQERQKELARCSRLSKEMLKRSCLLSNPFSPGLALQREIGYRKELHRLHGDAYIKLLDRRTLTSSNDFQIAKFLRDPRSGDVYAGVKGSGTCDIWACSPILDQECPKYDFNNASKVPLVGLQNGEITSLSMHHSGFLLAAASSYAGNTVQVTLTRLLTLDSDSRHTRRHVQDMSTDFRFPGSAVWSSAANSDSASPCFAVGISGKLHVFGIDHFTQSGSLRAYPSDILALEWLNRNTVMAGLNNSLVSFYDIRSNGSAMRLQHPHAVTNIRNVDDWRIAVAGRRSTLRIYDLRYAPGCLQSRPQPTKKKHFASPAYLSFSSYFNDMPGSDSLDVSPELGILASISGNNNIQAFSLVTGKDVSESQPEQSGISGVRKEKANVLLQKSGLTSFRYQFPITCLRFESYASMQARRQDEEHTFRVAPGITVSSGNMIDEWSI